MFANKFFSLVLDKGEDAKELEERYVYQLNLNVKEKEIEFGEDYIVPYGIKTKEIYTDHLQIVVKYLEFYRKLYYNEDVKLRESEIWLASLTAKTFSELKEMLSKVLTEAECERIIGDVETMSKDEFVLHEWKKDIMDDLVKREEERIYKAEGFAEGHAEGESKGKKENSIEIAKNMLKENTDVDFISRVTGLSKEEIENLK